MTPTTIAIAYGTDSVKLAMKSRERDERPPVSASVLPSGAGVARTSSTRARPSLESGSAELNDLEPRDVVGDPLLGPRREARGLGRPLRLGHRDQLAVDGRRPSRPAGRARSRSR